MTLNGKVDPKLYTDLEWRGIIKQITDPALSNVLATQPLILYAGFDPTSDSLHVGSLLPLLTLKRFQKAGHRVIAVLGGATGMIGDPSGKIEERVLLSPPVLKKNILGVSKCISHFLDLQGSNPAKIVNNTEWFQGVSYIDFLRDVGKHFTVNHMIAKESVRARLEDREHGISYTEFSYMLLQAYDFFMLHQKEKCQLQIGGSDQWGNITAGIELIRRMQVDGNTFGLTHPLVTKSDGSKFGKTEKGSIWLDSQKTSPFQFYQFFIQVDDADVIQYLKYFTFLSHEKISALEDSLKKEPEKRLSQKALAEELTRLTHGEQELERVQKASAALFGTEIHTLDEHSLLEVFAEAPATQKPLSALLESGGGLALVDILAETGLCSSKGLARKEITAGGVYLNNQRIQDPLLKINKTHLIANHYVLLRRGKRTYHLLAFH